MVLTHITQGVHVPNIPLPDCTLIFNNDDYFSSPDTESERGFSCVNADDDVSNGAIPNEESQGPNFAVDGEGCRRSTCQIDPIDRLVPGANNIRGYPETVWKSDTNGRLEQFNLWTF